MGFILIPILPDATTRIYGVTSLPMLLCISLCSFLSCPIFVPLTSCSPCTSFSTYISNSTFFRSISWVISSSLFFTLASSKSFGSFISNSLSTPPPPPLFTNLDLASYTFPCPFLLMFLSFLGPITLFFIPQFVPGWFPPPNI
jgi:hypothetical protein